MLTPGSLIQGNFGPAGNFEALLFLSGAVFHFWREERRADQGWNRGAEVLSDAIGPACLIQSGAGHLEAALLGQSALYHYRMDSGSKQWQRVGAIAAGQFAGGAICQNRLTGDLELVAQQGSSLRHYSYVRGKWQAGQVVTTHATGVPSLIQMEKNNNLVILAQEGNRIVLYFRDEKHPEKIWLSGGMVTDRATGPASLVQAEFGPENHRNLEAVIPEGNTLRHYWRNHSEPTLPWSPGTVITSGRDPIRGAALTVSSLQGGCLDVLVQEGKESLYHHFRVGRDPAKMQWLRGPCLRVEEGQVVSRGTSARVVQLTGQKDFVTGMPMPDADRHGIRGTDLGASFKHGGRTYFLFGDTHWTDNRAGATRDMIACTDATSMEKELNLRFARNCTNIISRQRVSQEEYDVPLDGFSHGGRMYVFFTTDHFKNRRVMYRSILTHCISPDPGKDISDSYHLPVHAPSPPVDFTYLADCSTDRFVNISNVIVGPSEIKQWNLPAKNRALLLWGSGAYRADTIALAVLPLDGPVPNLEEIRYFTGARRGVPQWSAPGRKQEEKAVPLFYPAAVGELSVRWDAVLKCFVLLYCPGPYDSAGLAVTMRVSKTPWGPWSPRRVILDWWQEGMGRYIHRSNTNDGLHQNDTPFPRGPEQGGAAYAPYQVADFTTLQGHTFTLYYTLSTWNPYQSVLMQHTMTRADVDRLLGMVGE